MRKLPTRLIHLGLLSLALGCNAQPTDVAPASSTAPAEVDAAAAPAIDPAAAKAIEQLSLTGAKLERGANQQVTGVDLRGIEVTDALAAEVAALPQLEKLTIDSAAMSLDGWQQLAKLNQLQQLDLRDAAVDNDQLAAAVSGMPKLKALRLSGKSGLTSVDDGGLAVLAKCPELKALAIDDLWVSTAGIQHLSQNKKLVELYAGGTAIDDEAARVLVELPLLKKLRLSRTGIGTATLETLQPLGLEDLDISEASGINDDSLIPLGKMASLKRLNLWRDTVTDSGVAHLAGLTGLQWLNLDNTHLSDEGLPHLSAMGALTFLHLGSTGVTDAGMPHLVSLKSLKDLKVTRTAVTEEGVAVVREAIPGVEVQLKYIEGE